MTPLDLARSGTHSAVVDYLTYHAGALTYAALRVRAAETIQASSGRTNVHVLNISIVVSVETMS